MKINVPPTVRFVLYVVTLLGSPVVAYLRAKGIVGDLEVHLWDAEVSAVAAMAAFNVLGSSSAAAPGVYAPADLRDVPAPPLVVDVSTTPTANLATGGIITPATKKAAPKATRPSR